MPTLIVTAHPDPDSLTHHVARRLRDALARSSASADADADAAAAAAAAAVVVADLAAEGFDPRFTLADRITYRTGADTPADVVAEQERLDRVTDVVLVFPVWWWSMPALLKGWVDRVFVNGWAFDVGPDGIRRNLGRLRAHLVAIAGDDAGVYERHGYEQALRTQVEHGVFDYCGMQRGASVVLYESEQEDAVRREEAVRDAVAQVAARVRARPAA